MSFGFDESYYLAQNPDVRAAVERGEFASGYDHYVKFGASELRNPNPLFNTADYAANNADVARAVAEGIHFTSVWDHYLQFGIAEGRVPHQSMGLFDEAAYLAANADVAAAVQSGIIRSGLEHYLTWGIDEQRVLATGGTTAQTMVASANAGIINTHTGAGIIGGGIAHSSDDQLIAGFEQIVAKGSVVDGRGGRDHLVITDGSSARFDDDDVDQTGGRHLSNVSNFEVLEFQDGFGTYDPDRDVGTYLVVDQSDLTLLNSSLNAGNFSLHGSNISYTGGGGVDWLSFRSTGSGHTIHTNHGDDFIRMEIPALAGTNIDMGAGSDWLELLGTGTGDLSASTHNVDRLTIVSERLGIAGEGDLTSLILPTGLQALVMVNMVRLDVQLTSVTLNGLSVFGSITLDESVTDLRVSGGGSIDLSVIPGQLSGVNILHLDDVATALTLSDQQLRALQAFGMTPTAAGPRGQIIGGNQSDSLTIKGGAVNSGDLDRVTGFETINFAGGAAEITTVDQLVADGQTLVVSAGNMTSGGLHWNGAAEANGRFDLSGSDFADTLIGGAGNDTIRGSDGDVLTGGDGHDSFILSMSVAPSVTNFVEITDFSFGDRIGAAAGMEDLVEGSGAGIDGVGGVTVQDGMVSGVADLTGFLANAGLVTDAAGSTLVWSDGTDSYAFVTDGIAGLGAGDLLVRLTGLPNLDPFIIDGVMTRPIPV